MRYFVTLPGGDEIAVDLIHRPGGRVEVLMDGEPVEVDAVEAEGATNVRVETRVYDLWLESDGETFGFVGSGHRSRARVESDRSRIAAAASRSTAATGGQIKADMPGRVVKVLVKEGDVVERGVPVIVVEAMKMENELSTDKPGVVSKILVSAGQTVEGGATLVELGPVTESAT